MRAASLADAIATPDLNEIGFIAMRNEMPTASPMGHASTPCRVVLIEDHEIIREGLASVVALNPGFTVVGQARGAREGLEVVRRETPDLVLCDYYLPDGTALDVLRTIAAAGAAARTLILSISGSDENVFRALQAGAAGYILKSTGLEELFRAMSAVAAGHGWMGDDLDQAFIRHSSRPALTQRESDVLRLLDRGQSNEEVAQALAISVCTVKSHVASIMQKLGAHNRTDAAARARRMGLIGM